MYFKNKDSSSASGKEEKMRSIHYKFLAVFWAFDSRIGCKDLTSMRFMQVRSTMMERRSVQ